MPMFRAALTGLAEKVLANILFYHNNHENLRSIYVLRHYHISTFAHLHIYLFQRFYFNAPEAYGIAMILQKDMPFGGFAKVFPYLVFTDGYQVAVGF